MAAASWLAFAGCVSARAEEVDVALVLAVDVSRSMSYDELAIQREGYAAAISHPDVLRAIEMGVYQRIAVTMFEWASDYSQSDIFGWTVIETSADAERLAAIIRGREPTRNSRTSISGAIRRGTELLAGVPHNALRKVIDISGDGPNNQGGPVLEARKEALETGIVINGLPLMTRGGTPAWFDIEGLDEYYADCVTGGAGSFIVPVNAWDQFAAAVRRKLVQEIGGGPSGRPAVIPASAAAESADCLIGEKIWEQRQWQFDGQ